LSIRLMGNAPEESADHDTHPHVSPDSANENKQGEQHAYGFLARVASGPTLSPLGQLATRVIVPRLAAAPRLVPGPPKRFAQGIGATLSVTAATLALRERDGAAARAGMSRCPGRSTRCCSGR
jgi:hypothetical protein